MDAPARRRAASKIDKATRRAELDRLMRRHGRRAPSDIVYEADADIKNENRLFYDAVDGQTGVFTAPSLTGQDPPDSYDLGIARLPLREARTVLHRPDWLRASRVETLNRRVRFAASGSAAMGRRHQPVWKSKFYGAFVLHRRVDLRAIDAMPARWRGGADSSPLDGASTARPRHRREMTS